MPGTGNNSFTKYRLSIRVFTDGFSLYIYNASGGLLQQEDYVGHDNENLEKVLQLHLTKPRIMEYEYDSVEFLAGTPTTYIPLDEFRREEMTALYRMTFSTKATDDSDIQYEILKKPEIVVLYHLSEKLKKIVLNVYPITTFHSIQGALLEKIAEDEGRKHSEGTSCYIQIFQKHLYVFTFTFGELHFACDYPSSTDIDRLYYILYVWKTLGLDAIKDICVLSDATESLIEEIKKYILHVETCA